MRSIVKSIFFLAILFGDVAFCGHPIKVSTFKKEFKIQLGKQLYQKALLGNVVAEALLAQSYHFGTLGFPKDLKKAFYWYTAALNHSEFMDSLFASMVLNNLGFMLKNGMGCNKDLEKAVDFFKQSINQSINHPSTSEIAYFNFAAMVYGGKGTPQDSKEAFKVFSQGVEKAPCSAFLLELLDQLEKGQRPTPQQLDCPQSVPSKERIQRVFAIFTRLLDKGEGLENNVLQWLADYMDTCPSGAKLAQCLQKAQQVLHSPDFLSPDINLMGKS